MFGLVLEPDEEPAGQFAVLPENTEALSWFMRMQTQWRVSMAGPVGLDYGVFLLWAREDGVKRKDRMWLLDDLRLMEGEYLSVLRAE